MATKPKKSVIDKELIRELAELLDETMLTEIEIEQSGLRVRVSRASGGAPAQIASTAPAPAAVAQPATEPVSDGNLSDHPGAVTSPMVGTAYQAASPGAEPYVKVGDTVSLGQTVMIVEAMKTMNQIPAPLAGKVTQILVENGQPVEFGEPLLIIE